MNISNLLGALAGVAALLAYAAYLRQALRGESTPNPASWGIWFLAGIINAFTYFSVVKGNIWQSLFVIAVTVSVGVVLCYALLKGRFSKITGVEKIIFALALCVGLFWQLTTNDRIANLLLQGIYMISYIPTLVALINARARERPTSWLIAMCSYTLATAAVASNFSGDWIAFISPVVNGLVGNGLVLTVIMGKKQNWFST